VNLAGADPTFRSSSIDVLASDMAAAAGYGASIVNVHTGSHRGTSIDAGLRRVADGVAQVIARAGDPAPRLVLENAAGGGDSVGTTIEEHARIAELAARLGVSEHQLGFCLDVAHAWGAGVAMGDPDGIDAWLTQFDRELGLRRLALIHLNDSRSERGSRTDRHEHIGAGRIGEEGFRHLLTHPALQDVPFVLETPGMDDGYDLINLQRARALIAGASLSQLPPEAFEFKRRAAASAPADDDIDRTRRCRKGTRRAGEAAGSASRPSRGAARR
jgi:deoxyribonuclease-4